MGHFHFPLERLLRLRQQQTRQAQQVLEHIAAQRRDMEHLLQQLQHRHDAVAETVQPGTFPAHHLQELSVYCQQLQQVMWQEQRRYEQLRELEQAQRTHLHEALQATEIFQRLRNRYWELFRRWMARQEQRQLDEVAQRRQTPWPPVSP